jgi:hypothetical protein
MKTLKPVLIIYAGIFMINYLGGYVHSGYLLLGIPFILYIRYVINKFKKDSH